MLGKGDQVVPRRLLLIIFRRFFKLDGFIKLTFAIDNLLFATLHVRIRSSLRCDAYSTANSLRTLINQPRAFSRVCLVDEIVFVRDLGQLLFIFINLAYGLHRLGRGPPGSNKRHSLTLPRCFCKFLVML